MAPAPNIDQNVEDIWSECPPRQIAGAREFLVSVDLYVPHHATSTLRKPPPSRRKSEKRVSSGPTQSSDEQKRVQEKPSWLSFARDASSSAAQGFWRPAICKLTEEGEACVLNIYVEDTILHHAVYIHLLRCTDIRPADRSLFLRGDCLGIHCVEGQRWTASPASEPIYIQFANTDAIYTWMALLRSYALPEVYGRRLAPADGGLYRMWRQVQVSIVQGRNIGSPKAFGDAQGSSGYLGEGAQEPDQVDMDVYCELLFGDVLCGRTTVKKAVGAPEWHESFTFPDLPPFGELVINVCREKKMLKSYMFGSIYIALGNFRRGENVEGWFPVFHGGPWANGVQVGEIRLKLKVEEEIILPSIAYSSIIHNMASRNYLDLMSELESRSRLENISQHVVAIAVANNVLLDNIFELANREVDGTPSSHSTLFRGNTVLTKTVELSMAWYGTAFLEASVGNVIRRICTDKIALEVDPVRSGKSGKDLDKSVEQLVCWCQEFWNSIYAVRGECPHELRRLFGHIRQLVEKRYNVKDPASKNRELPWQSVSAFCFLRFIVPAILHPHLFGLCPGLPPVPVQRTLTLIAKVIQSLANLNTAVQKEEFMRGVKDFMRASVPAMIDYILVVSTPVPEPFGPYPPVAADRHDRLHAMNSLRQRGPTMPTLHREAIPLLPHLLDVPKHLAILTSAVVRNAKGSKGRGGSTVGVDVLLDDFSSKCLEVEAHALQCVSRLAARPAKRPSTAPAMPRSPSTPAFFIERESMDTPTRPPVIRSPTSPNFSQIRKAPQVSLPPLRSRTLSRPSTAPPSSDSPALSRVASVKPKASQPSLSSVQRTRKVPRPSTAPSSSAAKDASRLGSIRQGHFDRSGLGGSISTHPNRSSEQADSLDQPQTTSSFPSPKDAQSALQRDMFSPEFDEQFFRHGTSPFVEATPTADSSDDVSKKRKGFLRGILSRR